MKRDMELIRKIVLGLEESDAWQKNLLSEGYTTEQISYHSYLLIDGEIAEGDSVRTNTSPYPYVQLNNLTWKGHEFADASRNDSIWNQAMKKVKDKGSDVPFVIFTQILASILKASFGLG